ncbi:MAG: hypothetical protein JNJ94_10620, partial [Chlorobi bacterium]|nr:hypothetical protein [Chlorobiota bacterium]
MATRLLVTTAAIAFVLAAVATAQNRDVRAQRFVLDDNNGNTVAIQTATGPITGGTLTIPDPAGSGSFLITTPSSGS